MNWADHLKKDALELAAPGFKLQPDDEIIVTTRFRHDEWLSSVTFEPGFFAIDVTVRRPTDQKLDESLPGQLIFMETATGQHYFNVFHRCYLDYEAQDFFVTLMTKGSEHD